MYRLNKPRYKKLRLRPKLKYELENDNTSHKAGIPNMLGTFDSFASVTL